MKIHFSNGRNEDIKSLIQNESKKNVKQEKYFKFFFIHENTNFFFISSLIFCVFSVLKHQKVSAIQHILLAIVSSLHQ